LSATARGQPLIQCQKFPGATGLYQIVAAALQLCGQVGENQMPVARYKLVQTLGSPAATSITHVLTLAK